ncbi:membrane protein insertion efficiency factor YidD [Myceligenerans indicum]|uniref:Putative membrane protein insertion efficiency factor n=1 Tax=Myceligenerans indicum TaxID=2593663 RepID=A0ABS1LNJ6_9MICO|nr:membrane protein insertion efficiency factor YidD [Myceligenerans indicum]MBL0887659.1 membrane protein insertion efficiency factor YidD [Myceligenerans indicum]
MEAPNEHVSWPHRVLDRVALAEPPHRAFVRPGRWWGARWIGIGAVRVYQRYVSPRLPARCRFVPTCSAYALHAVRSYGLLLGSRLALGRIQRCTRDVPQGTRDALVV